MASFLEEGITKTKLTFFKRQLSSPMLRVSLIPNQKALSPEPYEFRVEGFKPRRKSS